MGKLVYTLIVQQAVDLSKLHGSLNTVGYENDLLFNIITIVIGHSLGGQMAGYIGRWIIALSRRTMKLKRITALDPAKPMFYHIRNILVLPIPLGFFDADVRKVLLCFFFPIFESFFSSRWSTSFILTLVFWVPMFLPVLLTFGQMEEFISLDVHQALSHFAIMQEAGDFSLRASLLTN